MTKKIDLPLVLLALTAFLIPLIGGQIALEALSIAPSGNSLLLAMLGAPETPTLSHTILAALTSLSLIVTLWQRKILQVPNNTMSGFLLALFAIITASIGYSSFRSISLPAALEWLTYGVAFYAVVGAAGRQRGPTVLIASMFAGCVLLAILGIREYGDMKAIDPTHRIFPQWIGPNAMAAMLVIGFFLGLSLTTNTKGLGVKSGSERLVSLTISVGCVAIGLALFLTQSKGGIIALFVSLALYACLLLIWVPKKQLGSPIGALVAVVGIVMLLAGAMSIRPTQVQSGTKVGESSSIATPMGRLANASASADQSVGFRRLLWQSALKLIEENPIGSGIGTFQFESAKPGLVTQTKLAHQTYLQLATEASPLALLLFVGAIGTWFLLLLKGGSKLAAHQNISRAGVAAAVVAVLIHSFVDSDFSYYGVGLAVFLLFGIGLLLSTDAVAPEFMPPLLRKASIFGICVFTAMLGILGIAEGWRAQARGFRDVRQYNDAQNSLEALRALIPWDSEAWALSAQTSRNQADRIAFAKRAAELGPSTHNLRVLARVEADAGMMSEAKTALQRVTSLDPNNMAALTMLSEIQSKTGYEEDAKKTLQKLVDIEQTPYFKVRSLPELVATDTFHARLLLSQLEPDPKGKIALIQPAIDGFREYALHTVPNVLKFAQDPSGGMDFGGESVDKAKAKMTEAMDAAKTLAEAYRTTGEPALATAAGTDGALFAKALESVSFK